MNPLLVADLARAALQEDLGRAGDLTTNAIVPPETNAEALLVARAPGTLAGIDFVSATFSALDRGVSVAVARADGHAVGPGDLIARIAGPARAILTGERVALNFLGLLSGTATATATLVRAAQGTPAKIVCTRKTIPGLRAAQKYAVRCGGGHNHRFGLDDAILIKDNHIAIAGGIPDALARARAHAGHLVKIEIEVDTLEQLHQALEHGADAVLLDNMDPETLREAVRACRGRAMTEASGGIRPETAAAIAATGIDLLSAGYLTHSAPVLDIGLDM